MQRTDLHVISGLVDKKPTNHVTAFTFMIGSETVDLSYCPAYFTRHVLPLVTPGVNHIGTSIENAGVSCFELRKRCFVY